MIDHLNIEDLSSGDEFDYTLISDHRFDALRASSSYCQLSDIDESVQTFRTAKYCILHLNIHSLPTKYSLLRNLLTELKESGIIIHFVLLCETFLNDINAEKYHIPGYNFTYQNLSSSRGGVAMYILEGISFVERPDLCINIDREFESIAIEIVNSTSSTFVTEMYSVLGRMKPCQLNAMIVWLLHSQVK